MKINTTYNYNEDIGKTTKHTPSAFNADGADIAKKDTFIISSDNIVYENYNSIREKSALINAEHKLADELGKTNYAVMKKYINGQIPIDDIWNTFKNSFEELFNFQVKNGIIEDTDRNKTEEILRKYEAFVHDANIAAVNKCIETGNRIAAQYDPERMDNRDAVYYDADMYYECEDIKELLQDYTRNLLEEHGLDTDLLNDKFEKIEKNSHYMDEITFNGMWNNRAMNAMERCEMIDIKAVPPKGMTFFYKERMHSSIIDKNGRITLDSQVGIILIGSKNHKNYSLKVPYNNSLVLGELKDIFNAGELIHDKLDEETVQFLKNFNVYTRAYSSHRI